MISQRAKRIGLKELEIFDHFMVDSTLPKYSYIEKNELDGEGQVRFTGGAGNSTAWIVSAEDSDTISWGETSTNEMPTKFSLRVRIINWLIRKMQGEYDKDEKKKEEKEEKAKTKLISITEFFLGLTKSHQELTPIAEIAEHYEKALLQAKSMGQIALSQKLADAVQVVRGEAHLIALGLKEYVTERQIVDFYEKVGQDKCLKLNWIKNFNRIIPEEVYEAKKAADERKIFDNYVILHYDPLNTGSEMTKQEVKDKKDPILFGVIKNSRKLYYVADWKDDYCQLTLEEMFTVLGEKVLKINNKNVKTFISKMKA